MSPKMLLPVGHLDPHESDPQTASRSIQPFCTAHPGDQRTDRQTYIHTLRQAVFIAKRPHLCTSCKRRSLKNLHAERIIKSAQQATGDVCDVCRWHGQHSASHAAQVLGRVRRLPVQRYPGRRQLHWSHRQRRRGPQYPAVPFWHTTTTAESSRHVAWRLTSRQPHSWAVDRTLGRPRLQPQQQQQQQQQQLSHLVDIRCHERRIMS